MSKMEETYYADISIVTKNRMLMEDLLRVILHDTFEKAIHADPEIGLGIKRSVRKIIVASPIKRSEGGE